MCFLILKMADNLKFEKNNLPLWNRVSMENIWNQNRKIFSLKNRGTHLFNRYVTTFLPQKLFWNYIMSTLDIESRYLH